MASAVTPSSVTKTASFLVVPASRNEWASTRAPIAMISDNRLSARRGIGYRQTYQGDRRRSTEAIARERGEATVLVFVLPSLSYLVRAGEGQSGRRRARTVA